MLTIAPRAILYHKQSGSGRTRFLKLNYGGVVAFEKLPMLSQLIKEDTVAFADDACKTLFSEMQQQFGMSEEELSVDKQFHVEVDTPKQRIPVLLIRFTKTDPPIEKVASRGATFIHLTEAKGLTAVELDLLQVAYSAIMEG